MPHDYAGRGNGNCTDCEGTGRVGHYRPDPHTGKYSNSNYNCPTCKGSGEIKAAHGFHGMVYKPTHFLAGEAGRERVNITPMKKHSKPKHNEWSMNNVFDAGAYF